jgi:hypothetical protein
MLGQDDLEPSVRIRELKPDSVNFVLENVDLAYNAYRLVFGCLLTIFVRSDSPTR